MSYKWFYPTFALTLLLTMTGISRSASPAPPALVSVPGSIASGTFASVPGAAPAAVHPLHLTFALKSDREAGLQAFLDSQQDRTSPNYHRWLTPDEFGQRFGADDADIQAVVAYAASKGFATHVFSNRLFVEADTTVAQAESAFGVNIQGFQRPAEAVAKGEPPTFFGPDQSPRVPSVIAARLKGIFGLTDFVQMHPHTQKAAPTHAVVPIHDVVKATTGVAASGGRSIDGSAAPSVAMNPSFSGSLSPAQLSTVYEFDPLHALNVYGGGQSVGIYSPTGMNLSDVNAFASAYGLSGYTLNVVNTDGGNTNNSGDLEACLDVETIIGQAKNATVYIYEEPNDGSLNAWNRIASDNLPVISNSWGIGEVYCHNNGLNWYVSSWGTILSQMQSQGMSHYVATGDGGAFSGGVSNVNMPSSYPGSTATGGTENLTDDGSSHWVSETGWSGSTGGLSIYWSLPSWQSGPGVSNGYSNGMRQEPDISALGGPTPGYNIYRDGGWWHVWGTSASTPLWASANVLMNQGIGGRTGSLNSFLYYLGTYVNAFNNAEVYHDTTTGNNGYPATSKWDYVTGWGTARFWKLYADYALPADLYPFTPGGWNTPVMLSNSSSSFTEPAYFDNLTTYYITGSFANSGSADARNSILNVNLDGTDHTVNIISDPVNYFVYYQNMYSTTLSLGPHTFTLTADNNDWVYESNKNNNTYTRTITVRPYNDPFVRAFGLSGSSGNTIGTNAYASKESGEPNHGYNSGGASVWYAWTAPSTGYFNFNTASSNFDTTMGVYTGSSVSALTTIAEDDDSGGTLQSSVTFLGTAGTTYYIAVDGYNGATGNIVLRFSNVAPPNDNFVSAQGLGSAASGTVNGANAGATLESGEPSLGGQSVWYAWTAPSSGDYNFNTFGSNFNTELGVYTGSAVNALTTVGADDDADSTYQSSVSFTAVAGTTYYIAVDGYSANTGGIVLNWQPLAVTGLSASPSSIVVGGSSTGTVTLNQNGTQPAGSVVTLHSSNSAVTVPATATVPYYATTVTFPIAAAAGSVGTTTITATYNGGAAKTTVLTVAKAATHIAVTNVTGTIGTSINLTATLTRTSDNTALSGKTLTFTVDGVTAGTANTNASGVATRGFTIPTSLSTGNHTITVTFAGDTSYNAGSGTGTLTAKANTTLTVTNTTGALGQTVTLKALLKRATDGALITGRSVIFKIDGAAVGSATTDSTGTASYSYHIVTLTVANHTIAASYAGEALLNASIGSGTLTVSKAATHLAVTNVTGAVGATVNLTATLTRTTDNAGVSGRTLTFTVNGVSAGTAATNASGVATRSFVIPGTAAAGSETISVAFAGDTSYTAITGTGTLTVAKAATTLTVTNVAGSLGQTVTLTGTLKRTSGGVALSGKTLTFKVDSTTVGTAVTSSSGVATHTFAIPGTFTVGSHTITVSFAGDTSYGTSAGTGTLTASKASTAQTVPTVSGAHGTTVTLTSTLKRTTDSAVLSGKTISFKVGSTTVGSATTNASGIASISYGIPAATAPGNETITTTFAGDASYNASTGTGTLTVH